MEKLGGLVNALSYSYNRHVLPQLFGTFRGRLSETDTLTPKRTT
jgi:hypothetical protein